MREGIVDIVNFETKNSNGSIFELEDGTVIIGFSKLCKNLPKITNCGSISIQEEKKFIPDAGFSKLFPQKNISNNKKIIIARNEKEIKIATYFYK